MRITNSTSREPDMTAKVAVIYYSATGTVHALAQAVAEGAALTGAEVRLRRVAELAPHSAVDQNPPWRPPPHPAPSIAQASGAGPAWAGAFAVWAPTPVGTPAPPLQQVLAPAR